MSPLIASMIEVEQILFNCIGVRIINARDCICMYGYPSHVKVILLNLDAAFLTIFLECAVNHSVGPAL
jgi:hypothetical protein